MRKAIIIFLLLVSVRISAQTTWHVSTSGNDGNVGTIDSPWRTLSKACGDPNVEYGDVIYVHSGTYTETRQCFLPNGVSLVGDGIDQTIFNMSYQTTSYVGACIMLESYGHWGDANYGNQSISYLTLNGNLVGTRAIAVNFRSNVQIHHVKVTNFATDGIIFYGQATEAWTGTHPFESWKRMPSAWCTGNKLYASIITNCAAYTSAEGKGNVRYGQQNGFEMYGVTITQTARSAGLNGYGLKFFAEGFNQNTRVHDNPSIAVARRENGKFNFSIENWNDMGGCQYYNNNLQGQVDFTYTYDLIGAGYGSWFHHNIVGFSTTPQNTEVGVTPEAGLVSNCIISDNIFRNLTQAIVVQHIYPIGTEHPNTGTVNKIDIYNNLVYNIGESDTEGRWTYGSLGGIIIADYENNTGNVTDSISVYNNTIIASGIVRSNTYSSVGFDITGRQTLTNIFFRNNIVKGFTGATMYNAPVMAYGNMSNTNLKIEYNCFNGNGNNNLPLWEDHSGGQFVPGTGYSFAHNIYTDPLLTSEYKLSPSSPAIMAGIVTTLTTTDIAGSYWNSPPSMGCYEYTTGIVRPSVTTTIITEITSTTAVSGGNVTSTGGGTVTARGVCWSLVPSPTTAGSHTVNGTGPGTFDSYLTGLSPATVYYVRSYATNSAGTTYGNEYSFRTEPGAAILPGSMVKHNGRIIKYNGKIVRY